MWNKKLQFRNSENGEKSEMLNFHLNLWIKITLWRLWSHILTNDKWGFCINQWEACTESYDQTSTNENLVLCHMTKHQPMMAQYPLLALLLVLMLTSKPMNCMCPSQCDCSNKTVHCQGKDETKFGESWTKD